MLMWAHVPAHLKECGTAASHASWQIHAHACLCVDNDQMKNSHNEISPGIFMLPPAFGLIAK